MKQYEIDPQLAADIRRAKDERDAAERKLAGLLAQLPHKNKSHGMRLALGLCPQCGEEKPPGEFYCDKCQDYFSGPKRSMRAAAKLNKVVSTRYNNDEH